MPALPRVSESGSPARALVMETIKIVFSNQEEWGGSGDLGEYKVSKALWWKGRGGKEENQKWY